ncbi:hypothetical protein [Pyxidicoccus xibeiensis]|uniref:hypothetical protein n=1 Tax=Pyxidicoccus xibeiensis TaxID=2906759 RepID=UPI0020A81F17|nr:hypothetical protein [Pyxidicoccus xibeiensis]MCP3135797.1 hypothetical protein [Pyxidicoccus xibeiensis]
MTTGATPSATTPTADAEPLVRSNYVDCSTTEALQRQRQPTPLPTTPPLVDADGAAPESR